MVKQHTIVHIQRREQFLVPVVFAKKLKKRKSLTLLDRLTDKSLATTLREAMNSVSRSFQERY